LIIFAQSGTLQAQSNRLRPRVKKLPQRMEKRPTDKKLKSVGSFLSVGGKSWKFLKIP
jgi:hypothetical protein